MPTSEIVLPIKKPETEWVRGRALRKVSPTRDHSRVQTELAIALSAWSCGRGEIGTEWRLRIAPPGEERRPVAPDVAFVKVERLRGLAHEAIQAPAFAPDVAVEVLSPRDDPRDVAAKVADYLAAGAHLVVVVDPAGRTAILHDAETVLRLTMGDTLRHPALPDFELALEPFFARALDLPR